MQKVVLITGASSGIGKATALLLAQQGYRVYGAARRRERLQELTQVGVQLVEMDVTQEPSLVRGVQQVLAAEGRLDVLINNAGFGFYGAVEDVPLAQAREQLDVNLFGAARLLQLVLPVMRAQHSGKIINVSSVGGKLATPFGGWYHASKFALEGLSDSLRNEVKPFGIDVIVIEPGGIASAWGSIARANLLQTSGQSVYQEMARKFAASLQATEAKNHGPEVIARVIQRAMEATTPRTRYVAGFLAKPILFMRKILSDKLFDKIIMSQIR